jgi:lysine-specific demethylase 8
MLEPGKLSSADLDNWSNLARQGKDGIHPVLIPKAFEGVQRYLWDADVLADLYPKLRVPVTIDLPQNGVPYASANAAHASIMHLSELATLLRNGTACYMNQVPLRYFPALAREIDFERLGIRNVKAVNIWIGLGTKSGLHFDPMDNMFAQIHGRKRVLLFAPCCSNSLYPFPDVPSKSQVDIENPDLVRFARFATCPYFSHVLEPGDLLYLPKGWWHYFSTDELSISVNCWHGDTLSTSERTSLYLAAGPKLITRWLYDFLWHGVFGRPYEQRLFSPVPLGVRSYRSLRSSLTGFRKRIIPAS